MTTTVSKFGASSLRVGGRQRVEVDPSTDFDLNGINFSVDFWVRVVGTKNISPFAWYKDADNYFSIAAYNVRGTTVRFAPRLRQNAVNIIRYASLFHIPFLDGTFQHVELRNLPNFLAFIWNGSVINNSTGGYTPTTTSFDLSTYPLYIGMGVNFDNHELVAFDGYIDEFRVQKNVGTALMGAPILPYVRAVVTNGITHHKAYTNVVSEFSDYAGIGHRSISNSQPLYNKQFGNNLVTDITNHVARVAVSTTLATYNGSNQRSVNAGFTDRHVARGAVSAQDNNYTNWHGVLVHASFIDSEKQYINIEQNDQNYHRALLPITAVFIDNSRMENTALALFELYHNLGSLPDFVSPLDTSVTLPVVSTAISGEGIHYFVLRKRNKYNQVSRNIEAVRIELDNADNQIIVQPTGPFDIAAEITDAGLFEVSVEANYNHGADHDLAADQWVIYSSDVGIIDIGSWPEDGSNPQTTTVDMDVVDGIVRIKQAMTVLTLAGYLVGVRTKRSSDGRISSTIQKLHVESTTAGGGGGTPITPVPEFIQ